MSGTKSGQKIEGSIQETGDFHAEARRRREEDARSFTTEARRTRRIFNSQLLRAHRLLGRGRFERVLRTSKRGQNRRQTRNYRSFQFRGLWAKTNSSLSSF